jgi:hypothetical protein
VVAKFFREASRLSVHAASALFVTSRKPLNKPDGIDIFFAIRDALAGNPSHHSLRTLRTITREPCGEYSKFALTIHR